MANEQSDTAPIIAAIERLSEVEIIEGLDDVIVVPKATGKEVVDLRPIRDKRLERPRRAIGVSHHTTLESIIAHANRQKLDRSALFACDDPAKPKLVVIYNYDDASDQVDHEDDTTSFHERADFRDHRAEYAFPLSEEWLAWTKIAGEQTWLGQGEFAELLEARVLDVLDPSAVPESTKQIADKLEMKLATPAAILTCSKGLALKATQNVVQAVSLSSGETEIQFAEKHESAGKGATVVPSAFALRVPIFRGGAPYVVLARLRYRLNEGSVRWGVRLHRIDVCFRDAFNEAVRSAAEQTKLPLFFGTPES